MRITIKEIYETLGKHSDASDTRYEPITDARKITQGSVFFALHSPDGNGWEYLDEARNRGAQWAVVPESVGMDVEITKPAGLNLILAPDPVQLLGQLAQKHYQYPQQLTAVTGTNGKSSTCYYCAQLSQQMKLTAGIIGTFGIGPLSELKPSPRTTPDLLFLHESLNEMLLKGVETVALEASSEGLDQRRLVGVPIKVAIFTNLSRDHLNYHKTMDAYRSAKQKLFSHPGVQLAVINMDDPIAESMIDGTDIKCYRYSITQPEADFYANVLSYEADGMRINLHTPIGNQLIHIPLLGAFNVSNALAALAGIWDTVDDKTELINALTFLKGAPGRMQQIKRSGQPLAVVDYAHTPDALEVSLRALRQHTTGKIFCVFGCGGDRDKGKRPQMTKAALAGADIVILTSDNPRFEDPLAIMKGACENIPLEALILKGQFQQFVDRREAIKAAITLAGPQDTVLISGKGHETFQDVCGEKHHFDDIEEVKEALDNNIRFDTKPLLEPET